MIALVQIQRAVVLTALDGAVQIQVVAVIDRKVIIVVGNIEGYILADDNVCIDFFFKHHIAGVDDFFAFAAGCEDDFAAAVVEFQFAGSRQITADFNGRVAAVLGDIARGSGQRIERVDAEVIAFRNFRAGCRACPGVVDFQHAHVNVQRIQVVVDNDRPVAAGVVDQCNVAVAAARTGSGVVDQLEHLTGFNIVHVNGDGAAFNIIETREQIGHRRLPVGAHHHD